MDLFYADSTNIEVPGFIPSEHEISSVLDSMSYRATEQTVVASFASHVRRAQQILNTAIVSNRRAALVGRLMVRDMETVIDKGFL